MSSNIHRNDKTQDFLAEHCNDMVKVIHLDEKTNSPLISVFSV